MISFFTSNIEGLPFVQKLYNQFTHELHWSDSLEISIILQGEMSFNYKNHTRLLKTHDIVFFMPFENHTIIRSSSDAILLQFAVESDFIQRLLPNYGQIHFQNHHISYDLGNQIYYSICQEISKIVINTLKTDTSSRLYQLSAMTNILSLLFDHFGVIDEQSAQADYVTDRLTAIIQYINEHYAEKISVRAISEMLGLHPQYFSSFFNRHFHTSFSDYLTTFRINKSLNKLVYTNETILSIALDCGFANHKTYALAFKKLFGVSPTEYRKSESSFEQEAHFTKQMDMSEYHAGFFAFFKQFDITDSITTDQTPLHKSLTLYYTSDQLGRTTQSHPHNRTFTVGRALACLRSDVQTQIKRARTDLNIDYLRIRDIFSDSLYVYHEDSNGNPIFNWQTLDSVFDFFISIGVKPFAEIGYMPEKLASKKQYAPLQFRPNVSAPKSITKWCQLIECFLTHCIDRYGQKEVEGWMFDFWTSPDLNLQNKYWYESKEEFFEFYYETYKVFRNIDSNIIFGLPNFSTISGFEWYDDILAFCREKRIQPDFVAIHAYGCELVTSFPTYSKDYNAINQENYSIADQSLILKYIDRLKHIIQKNNFSDLPIVVSDFNLNFFPTDLIRDTCYLAPYIAHTILSTIQKIHIMGFWSLSDINEDAYSRGRHFWGGPGLVNYQGVPKAAYNALVLLGKLGSSILEIGENYALFKKDRTWQLLIYNLAKLDDSYTIMQPSQMDAYHRYTIYSNSIHLMTSVTMEVPAGTYLIKSYDVNRDYGSAYDIWGNMGYPETMTKDMEDYLEETSKPYTTYAVQTVRNTLLIDHTTPVHGVTLIEITKA